MRLLRQSVKKRQGPRVGSGDHYYLKGRMDEGSPHKKLKDCSERKEKSREKVVSHISKKKVFPGELLRQRHQIKMVSGLSNADTTGDLSLVGTWLRRIGSGVAC